MEIAVVVKWNERNPSSGVAFGRCFVEKGWMSREEGINKPQLIREKFTISVPTIFEENDEKFVLRLVFVLRQTLTL